MVFVTGKLNHKAPTLTTELEQITAVINDLGTKFWVDEQVEVCVEDMAGCFMSLAVQEVCMRDVFLWSHIRDSLWVWWYKSMSVNENSIV